MIPLSCPVCDGAGEVPYHGDRDTRDAPGFEERCERRPCVGDYHYHVWRDCEECKGRGVAPCHYCHKPAVEIDKDGNLACEEEP